MFTQVANLARDKEEIPQLYVVGGRGPRATLAVLRPGLAVTELAVSPLPGMPNAVFTCKRALGDEFDAYIIVSFANATLVSGMLTLAIMASTYSDLLLSALSYTCTTENIRVCTSRCVLLPCNTSYGRCAAM